MATRTKEELIKEARAFSRKAASGGVTTADQAVPEKDPAEKGQVSAPNHPDGDSPEKTEVPKDPRPTNDTEQPDGVTEGSKTNPGPSGTDRKPTLDGDARDAAFTSPTTPLDKIASQVRAPLANILRYSQANGGDAVKNASVTLAPAQTEEAPGVGAFMLKLAQALLSTERGMQVAEDYLAEYEGAEQARALIQKAASDQAAFHKVAGDLNELLVAANHQFNSQLDELGAVIKSASADEVTRWQKLANAHVAQLGNLDPEFHAYYKAGSADAAMVVEAMMMGEEPGIPGGEGDLAPEQLEGLIAQLVQAGQLDPETAEQLLQALMGGGEEMPPEMGGGVPGGEEMPPEMGGGAPGGEEMPPEEKAARLLARFAV
jgi:hypothetical protein